VPTLGPNETFELVSFQNLGFSDQIDGAGIMFTNDSLFLTATDEGKSNDDCAAEVGAAGVRPTTQADVYNLQGLWHFFPVGTPALRFQSKSKIIRKK
jgi:hypothetical protein